MRPWLIGGLLYACLTAFVAVAFSGCVTPAQLRRERLERKAAIRDLRGRIEILKHAKKKCSEAPQ